VIGLDTNILIRYLMKDDPGQAKLAAEVLNGFDTTNQGYISHTTLNEMVWVLSGTYKQTKDDIIGVIEKLLSAKELVIESAEVVHLALEAYRRSNAGFADAMISQCGLRAGCSVTLTFDKKAANMKGMTLLA